MKVDPNRLHEATDRLNAALVDAENALAELNLGVTASVPIPAAKDDLKVRALCFGKVGSAFQLSILIDGETQRVTSVSRELRLRVVPLLPQLRDALLSEYNVQLTRVEEGTSDVVAFTETLRQGSEALKDRCAAAPAKPREELRQRSEDGPRAAPRLRGPVKRPRPT